jgi:hypothetical protein
MPAACQRHKRKNRARVVCAIVAVIVLRDAERLIADIHGGLQHSHAAAVPASAIFC